MGLHLFLYVEVSALILALLAFLLGVKHSFDADHLVGVSNLLTKSESVSNTTGMGVSWAMGHMITASAITALLFHFKDILLPGFLGHFDVAVAIMLIALGLYSLKDLGILHVHIHQHDETSHVHYHVHTTLPREKHFHKHMFGIGIVHGLASNDELLLLLTLSLGLTTLVGLVWGIAIFSLGVIAGMLAYSLLLNRSMRMFGGERMKKAINFVTGVASIAYGSFLLV